MCTGFAESAGFQCRRSGTQTKLCTLGATTIRDPRISIVMFSLSLLSDGGGIFRANCKLGTGKCGLFFQRRHGAAAKKDQARSNRAFCNSNRGENTLSECIRTMKGLFSVFEWFIFGNRIRPFSGDSIVDFEGAMSNLSSSSFESSLEPPKSNISNAIPISY